MPFPTEHKKGGEKTAPKSLLASPLKTPPYSKDFRRGRNEKDLCLIHSNHTFPMPTTDGIIAALTAPLLEAVGFLEWESHWAASGGSAFALNMYKCNFASLLFLFMAVYSSNKPFLDCSISDLRIHNGPFSLTAQNEKKIQEIRNPINNIEHVHPEMILNELGAEQWNAQEQMKLHEDKGRFEEAQQEIRISQKRIEDMMEQRQQNGDPNLMEQQLQQHPQQQENHQGRRLQVTAGEQPVDYIILADRRKKTPYEMEETSGAMQDESGDLSLYYETLPPCPDDYRPPFSGQKYQISYIILSSFLGIIIGDCAELEALRLIGARRVLVVDTIKPFAAALIGNLLLGEALYPAAFVGILLTTLGVYVVLMASIEKIEKVKEKKRRGHIKRNEELIIYQGNDDMSVGGQSSGGMSNGDYSFVSDDNDSFGEDDEIIALRNDEDKPIGMVGMHRRPLSRHDLAADVDELLGDDGDNIVMLLEDGGKGIIDKTICCNPNQRNRLRKMSSGSWSSKLSMADISISSGGSLEELNTDLAIAEDNFESNEEDFFFSDGDIGQPDSPFSDKNDSFDEQLKEAISPTIEISIPTPSKSKPLKSALKKTSRYNLKEKDLDQSGHGISDNSNTSSKSKCSEKDVATLPVSNSSTPDKKPKKFKRLSSFNSTASGAGSIISIDTECGPPPGLYGSDMKRETNIQRKARLRTGYCLATVNVLLDSYASYLTKKYGYEMNTWEINLCRLGFAATVMSSLAIFMRMRDWKKKRRMRNSISGLLSYAPVPQKPKTESKKMKPWYLFPRMPVTAWITVSFGVIFVTFFAPALANYSLFQIPLALSVSLCSVTPLYTLPLGVFMKGERPSRRGYLGAAFSVLGVAILCIWGLDPSSLS